MQAYKFARGELRTLLQGRSIYLYTSSHKPKTLKVSISPLYDHSHDNIDFYENVINTTTGAACVREALQLPQLSKATITLELTKASH